MSGFKFDNQEVADIHTSLSFLIKGNNGAYKSGKQAEYIFKKLARSVQGEIYGVVVEPGQRVIQCEYTTRWADYGTRSVIPGLFVFVLDGKGVVGKFKVPFNGNMRDGARPDPSRTSTMFMRSEGLELVDFLAEQLKNEQKAAETSQYIGEVGQKSKFAGTIKSIMSFGMNYNFSYYGTESLMTVVEVNGQEVVWWNAFPDAEVGDTVEFIARVKDHKEYKGKKQTVITRPSKVVLTQVKTVEMAA